MTGESHGPDLGTLAANSQHVKGASSQGSSMPTHSTVGVSPHHVVEDAPKDHLHVGDTTLAHGDFQDQVHIGKQEIPMLGSGTKLSVPVIEDAGNAFESSLEPGTLTPTNLPQEGAHIASTMQSVGNTEAAKGFAVPAGTNAEADHGMDVAGSLSSGGAGHGGH